MFNEVKITKLRKDSDLKICEKWKLKYPVIKIMKYSESKGVSFQITGCYIVDNDGYIVAWNNGDELVCIAFTTYPFYMLFIWPIMSLFSIFI